MRGSRPIAFRLSLAAVLLLLPIAAAAEGAAADDTITIAAVGDIMLGSTWSNSAAGSSLPPDDGAELLKEAAPVLTHADVAFGNLEGPLIDHGKSAKCAHRKKCYVFRVPTRYGRLLKQAGFGVLSLANNHAFDFGVRGRTSTRDVLDDLGIEHTGEVGDIAHLEVRGRSVAVIAFSADRHSYNLNNLDTARAVVKQLVDRGELVIVSFHGGGEGPAAQHVARGSERFAGENRGDLRRFTHAMIDKGAALVVGHGPHVLRGMEIYRHHLIAYSLGNFATYAGMYLSGPSRLTTVLEVRLASDGTLVDAMAHPFVQLHRGGPVRDRHAKSVAVLQQLSEEDFPDTAAIVTDDGKILDPEPAPRPVEGSPQAVAWRSRLSCIADP